MLLFGVSCQHMILVVFLSNVIVHEPSDASGHFGEHLGWPPTLHGIALGRGCNSQDSSEKQNQSDTYCVC